MSLSVTHDALRLRCLNLAKRIADDLATRQLTTGHFEQPDFYAKAFAVDLWRRLDPVRFGSNIERALDALRSETRDKTWHREFIEYALLDTPGLSSEAITDILRGAKPQCPDVANWQILGLINRQKRNAGLTAKFLNLAHFAFILFRYWRAPVFMDRPDCFSAQYHAFCAALLSDSPHKRHRRIANRAAEMLTQLASTHGFVNLLGRGAGQSFGAACGLYVLLKESYHNEAEAILHRLEDALLKAGQLPLNLLAPAPLPEKPGPETPQTPGWYSYNRHDDYLAFAGYWLLKASQLPAPKQIRSPASATIARNTIAQFSSSYYHAQMTLCGRQNFDVSGAPVIVSGQGKSARIFLPPTGGEQDAPSLYDHASQPLPAIGETEFSRFLQTRQISDNKLDISFELAGIVGLRTIEFQNARVIISDLIPDCAANEVELFRILIDGNIGLTQIAEDTIICRELGIKLTANAPLQIIPQATFSAAGPATRISAKTAQGYNATLTISWGRF
ncbi:MULTISPECIES: hypothetical protein [unclassified Thalassospira]|uniref:hypothetical protein n=1 Tax=unclassified Thalassospira TaxID=2648997 RepID=UPI0007A639E5|nr:MULTISPECIES: hypothetical protein [unclassified Thalassospira]KZD00326.1 hypothetical protein AUQ41_07015 [Thalassospira sp. MCCC 1A02898]ONH87301.1 hypothetical protein TH47_12710 [Thalassospira sp. MCCC 1A02803]